MAKYGDPLYWDKRYKEQEGVMFDWLENYESIKPLIEELVNKDGRVLVPGCGNAMFSEDMYDDGYENIDNCDISSIVIEQMKARNKNRTKMRYDVMDMKGMSYPSNYYDLVIDKGAIDTLLCGACPFYDAAFMTKEVQRVLKPNGYYMVISYGTPENRVLHFKRPHLSFEIQQYTIEEEEKKESRHYIYVCKKLPNADEVSNNNWVKVKEALRNFDESKNAYGELNELIENENVIVEICNTIYEIIKGDIIDLDKVEHSINSILGKVGSKVTLDKNQIEKICNQFVSDDPNYVATIVRKALEEKRDELEESINENYKGI